VSATALTGGALAALAAPASAATERAWITRQWQTTKMVGVARTKAQAYVEVRDRHGMSRPICTPFIGH
jgi:hypothetical protein